MSLLTFTFIIASIWWLQVPWHNYQYVPYFRLCCLWFTFKKHSYVIALMMYLLSALSKFHWRNLFVKGPCNILNCPIWNSVQFLCNPILFFLSTDHWPKSRAGKCLWGHWFSSIGSRIACRPILYINLLFLNRIRLM